MLGKFIDHLVHTPKDSLLGWGMIGVFIVFNSFGAVVVKNEVLKTSNIDFNCFNSFVYFFYRMLCSWKTWLGLFSIGLGTGGWMISLTRIELSKAYPIAIGLNLLLITAASFFRFHEPLTLFKTLGLSLILLGIFLIAQ